jgi:hypothetical protein
MHLYHYRTLLVQKRTVLLQEYKSVAKLYKQQSFFLASHETCMPLIITLTLVNSNGHEF